MSRCERIDLLRAEFRTENIIENSALFKYYIDNNIFDSNKMVSLMLTSFKYEKP